MKPILILMEGFGPFHKITQLDLEPYYHDGLLLLRGETGSGKTSVLDAMTIALYGKSSGGKKGDLEAMRCQHAKPTESTTVRLEMKALDTLYRFERSLRPVKKRDGSFDLKSEQSIERFNSKHATYEPLHANLTKTLALKEAERITGLTYDQFCQVVILPQGQFERFLTAKSEDKEQILSSIFAADQYEEAASLLKEKANHERSRLERDRQEMERILRQAEVETRDEFEENVAALKNERAKSKNNLDRVQASMNQAREQLATGRLLATKFNDRATELRTALEIEERRDEMSKIAETVKKAQEANPLRAEWERMDDAATQLEKRTEKVKELRSELIRVTHEAQAAATNAVRLPELDSAISKKELEIAEINRMREEHGTFLELKQRLEAKRKEQDDLLTRIKAREERRAALQTDKERHSAKISERENLMSRRAEQKIRQEQLTRLASLDRSVSQTAETLTQATENSRLCLAELERAINQLNRLSAEHKAGMLDEKKYWADVLHGDLREGEPCPVCGVPHHQISDSPSDPTLSDREKEDGQFATPESVSSHDSDRLKRLESELTEAGQSKAIAEQKAAIADERVRSNWSKLQEQTESMLEMIQNIDLSVESGVGFEGDFSSTKRQLLMERLDVLREWMKRTNHEHARSESELNAELEQMGEAERALGELTDLETKLDQEGLEDKEKQTSHEITIAKLQGATNKYEDSVKFFQQSSLNAEELLELAGRELDKLKGERASIAGDKQQTQTLHSTFRELHKAARTEENQALLRLEYERRDLEQLLVASPFVDLAAVEAAVLPDLELKARQAQLEEWRVRVLANEKRLSELNKELQGKQEPDLNQLQTDVAELEKSFEDETANYHRVSQECERLSKELNDYLRRSQKIGREVDRVERLMDFAVLLKGEKGVSLRRYVISIMLNSVLQEANSLLRYVHNGRYQLHRSRESDGREHKVGLHFTVRDAYSDRQRSVSTLSGGEKFLVSLALSLGLSSVVQLQTGGVRIQAMFIDEGFGSLDSSSVGEALDMLIRERREGRLIGIISHVQDLKDSIPLAIDVIKSPVGSELKVLHD